MKVIFYDTNTSDDFFLVDDNHLGFTIADVSDKGIPAAIFMAISRTVIRATALRQLSPAVCMKDGKSTIDPTLCVGCTVCAQVCPVGAISRKE